MEPGSTWKSDRLYAMDAGRPGAESSGDQLRVSASIARVDLTVLAAGREAQQEGAGEKRPDDDTADEGTEDDERNHVCLGRTAR